MTPVQKAEEYAEEHCKECYMCSADGKRNKCHFYTKRKQGFIDGYNKANEWHIVANGDLPEEDIYLVIKLNDVNTCYKYCTGFWEKEEKCFHTLFCDKVDVKDILAWKEIKGND